MILISKLFLVAIGFLQGTLEAPALPLAVAPTSGWPNSQGPQQNISEMGFSEPP